MKKGVKLFLILVFVLALGAGVYFYNNRLEQDVNILLMGVDSSDPYTHHADTMIVVHFAVKDKKVAFISIPRDTKVTYRSKARKINSVYVLNYNEGKNAKANAEMLKVVEAVLKEKVRYYAQVDYDGVKNIVDYFGGVRVNIESKMYYVDNADGLLIYFKPGSQTLNGADAVKFLRFRKDNKADVGRMERQQKFMFTLASTIMEKLEARNILGVFSAVSKSLNTNFPPDRAAYLYKVFKDYDLHSSSKVILPGDPVYESKIAYWKPDSKKIKEIFR
ncbi:MAG: hypothetical protein A2452_12585 [Candidatus Firestonebacteria bacterium RIFOXYC2_FULL_39_67]|nr:MAG: hypothetical protein A2536_05695 [Candidatus Firestonebacteria bacterium RIFOXYD2_FULL_39_29]OGF52851.1 MAG: hypothetical protein A2497_01125 [Candidatus Firestonebacteria bacterium RifOxyC12_full_39_7]OGF57402.1 MAG: hypothetical protein A2452_12585 [Candidatus Firestonebacteria bacterium RIFOXYC2_FULL_39_67]